MLFDIGRTERDRSGRAEDLEKLVDPGEFGKLREEFFFVDEREKSPLFERANGRCGRFFQRLIDRVTKITGSTSSAQPRSVTLRAALTDQPAASSRPEIQPPPMLPTSATR